MIQIRPVSDLRNKFPEIETLVNSGNPVYLTKNGYGAMVVLSLEEYASLTDNIEMKLDEADRQAAGTDERLSHESVFKNARSAIHGKLLFSSYLISLSFNQLFATKIRSISISSPCHFYFVLYCFI